MRERLKYEREESEKLKQQLKAYKVPESNLDQASQVTESDSKRVLLKALGEKQKENLHLLKKVHALENVNVLLTQKRKEDSLTIRRWQQEVQLLLQGGKPRLNKGRDPQVQSQNLFVDTMPPPEISKSQHPPTLELESGDFAPRGPKPGLSQIDLEAQGMTNLISSPIYQNFETQDSLELNHEPLSPAVEVENPPHAHPRIKPEPESPTAHKTRKVKVKKEIIEDEEELQITSVNQYDSSEDDRMTAPSSPSQKPPEQNESTAKPKKRRSMGGRVDFADIDPHLKPDSRLNKQMGVTADKENHTKGRKKQKTLVTVPLADSSSMTKRHGNSEPIRKQQQQTLIKTNRKETILDSLNRITDIDALTDL